jgi:hypothetical protein
VETHKVPVRAARSRVGTPAPVEEAPEDPVTFDEDEVLEPAEDDDEAIERDEDRDEEERE